MSIGGGIMTQWKPSWWARAFGGSGSWALSIGEGRLRVRGIPRAVDADVLDILGLSRRAVREVAAAYRSELDERRHLAAPLSRAEEQGDAARERWSEVQRTMGRPRWADRETIAALQSSRPDVTEWVAADADPHLAAFFTGRRGDERAAVEACRATDLPRWAAQRNESFLEWEKGALADFFRTVEKSPLTEEQTRATVCFDNRVRVIAAAGSGKTSTMLARWLRDPARHRAADRDPRARVQQEGRR
jgi:DNA helicase-4